MNLSYSLSQIKGGLDEITVGILSSKEPVNEGLEIKQRQVIGMRICYLLGKKEKGDGHLHYIE